MTFTWEQIQHLRAYYGTHFEGVMGKFSDTAIAVDLPKKGQRWVRNWGGVDKALADYGGSPVLILPPKRKVTVTDIVFRATGETRCPKKGEWFRGTRGGLALSQFDFEAEPLPIYTRHEETREIEVDE